MKETKQLNFDNFVRWATGYIILGLAQHSLTKLIEDIIEEYEANEIIGLARPGPYQRHCDEANNCPLEGTAWTFDKTTFINWAVGYFVDSLVDVKNFQEPVHMIVSQAAQNKVWGGATYVK